MDRHEAMLQALACWPERVPLGEVSASGEGVPMAKAGRRGTRADCDVLREFGWRSTSGGWWLLAEPLRAAPEPAPRGGEGDVWAEVIEQVTDPAVRALCALRRLQGISRYGQPLRRGDGRCHRVDGGQEYQDAAVYRASTHGARDERVHLLLAWAADELVGHDPATCTSCPRDGAA